MTSQPSEVKRMSTREKVMGEEKDMPPRTFKANRPNATTVVYSDILRSKLLRINETLKVHYLRKCWGHRAVYMGDLPPSVTEEWVRELVGNIGAYSYMKVSSLFCVII